MDFYNNTELKVYQIFFFVVTLLICYSYHKKDTMTLVYAKGSNFEQFVKKTQFDKIEFKPYFLAFNRFFQNVAFICIDNYRHAIAKQVT